MVGNRLAVGLPVITWLKRSFGPLWSISLSSTPHFLAKPRAAWVGLPSASNAAWRGGPSRLMLRSGCWVSSAVSNTARRRGAA